MVVAVHLLKSHREAKRSHSWKHSNIGKPSEPSEKVDTISDIPFSNVTTDGCKSIKHRAMKGDTNMKNNYVVIGATWRDKVNGNTYFNSKIIVITSFEDGHEEYSVSYLGFQYGYGNAYFSKAVEKIKSLDPYCGEIIDGGSFSMKKRDLKNNWF